MCRDKDTVLVVKIGLLWCFRVGIGVGLGGGIHVDCCIGTDPCIIKKMQTRRNCEDRYSVVLFVVISKLFEWLKILALEKRDGCGPKALFYLRRRPTPTSTFTSICSVKHVAFLKKE